MDSIKGSSLRIGWVALLIGGLLAAGCVTLDQPQVPLDAPALIRPLAQELRGVPREQVLVQTRDSVSRVPLDAQSIRRLAEQVRPAVLSLYVESATPVRIRLLPINLPFTGIRVRLPGVALGSGFFIHPSGYLLTNNHVIQDARGVRALTQSGEEYDVEIVARDPVYDLALCRVKASGETFPVIPMGQPGAADVGDLVIAVGNPLGLGHTVTAGIISQTGRNLSGVPPEDARQVAFIQTDAAINPGSSGGPLISLQGAWVGVNTAGILEAQSLGFAVPASEALEFLDEVLAGKGDPDRGQY